LPQRDLVFLPYLASWLTQTLVERGDLEGAARALGLSSDPGQRDPTAAAVWRYGRARLRIARGQTRLGLSDLLACGEALDASGAATPPICQWRSRAALAHARLGGDREEAAPLAAEAVELARAWGAPRPLGAALRAQALVHDADIEILRESVNILDNSPGRLELARARRPRGGAAPGGTPRRGARAAAPGRGARRRLRHLTVSGPLGIVVRAWEPGGVGMAVCPLSLDDLGGVAAGVVGCPGPLIGTCSR
jgi:hypothetical protein